MGFFVQKFNLPLTSGEESNAGQPAPAANETQGGQQNEGSGAETEASLGSGRIVINGEPRAESHGFCELRGVRRGVDGLWKIISVEHIYSREGYIVHGDGGRIAIFYRIARPGLAQTVPPGALSFEGVQIGDQITGTVYSYTEFCPGMRFPYPVIGGTNGVAIMLDGMAAAVETGSCTIVGFTWSASNSHLAYVLVQPAVAMVPVPLPVPVPMPWLGW